MLRTVVAYDVMSRAICQDFRVDLVAELEWKFEERTDSARRHLRPRLQVSRKEFGAGESKGTYK